MGMFDNVLVECPIEGVPSPAVVEWQTKDFAEPSLDRYKISAEGRLLEEIVRVEDRSEFAATGQGDPFCGCMTRVHEGWRDMEYHGDLHFYGFLAATKDGLTHVTARFTHGSLESITAESAS